MSRRTARHPDEPSLVDLQHRVHTWIGQFEEGYWPPLSMLARLTEEVGELARELNHTYGHKPKKPNEPPGDVALEIADIVFVLLCLANSLGIDLGAAFEQVMHKYDQRDGRRWTRRGPHPAPVRSAARARPKQRRTRTRPSAARRVTRRSPARRS